MTQQHSALDASATAPEVSCAEPSAPVAGATVPTGGDHSTRAQIDAAMARLLGVSAKFKDLTGQDRNVSTREETIAMMHHYLRRLGLQDAVRQLSVVHVAGTKGKGSTCAMVERILREAGYKTGLFTSPHLITPCERIRIDGKPVSEPLFLRHFDAVWDALERTADQSGEYPPMAWFFRFLTLLALHVFVAERVDVVILEVGIGGRLDATNVIERPVVCGVSTLDLDHVRVLGDSLAQIAYAKAGIFKRGVPAFTTAQEASAMAMLRQCAADTQTPLLQAPPLDELGPDGARCELGMQGDYQRVNAGLAAALAATWLQHKRGGGGAFTFDPATVLEPVVRLGLAKAFWPARSHVVEHAKTQTRFYIDGAHTQRSLEVCAQWFQQASTRGSSSSSTASALIFTIHHERNVASLVAPLLALPFTRVYFCRTGASRPSLAKVLSFSEALAAADLGHIVERYNAQELAALDDVSDCGSLQWPTTLARVWTALATHHEAACATVSQATVRVLPSVAECVADLDASVGHVLVTGSLYLAGETLAHLGWHE
ncbi:hypothetical protein PINS_up003300 [Pythium insidiosum]|nr:hypothetical protein PINS_up003300 [Pythium insidiosum]